jgi:hypothetical protein
LQKKSRAALQRERERVAKEKAAQLEKEKLAKASSVKRSASQRKALSLQKKSR